MVEGLGGGPQSGSHWEIVHENLPSPVYHYGSEKMDDEDHKLKVDADYLSRLFY